ncbi:amidase [Citricoccus sp. GCM10030269]|uniref:amidase n=1 Tax=Citricoccus sp. GCM10030269 TaxID=3273388 RepID=UPI00360F7BC2
MQQTGLTPFSSMTDIASAIRTRRVHPEDVTEMYLDRIERFNPELNAIVWIDPEASRSEATDAGRVLRQGDDVGPLHGVPVPVKDLTPSAGQPCFMGSLGTSEEPSTVSELAITALQDAGAVRLGRSHAPEAGTMSVTETQRFGIARNPWDPSLSPAGSSGGAAAAVAAGLAPFAHASDGGGSIRNPASSCGLVGLKPSRGRVPALTSGWEHAATEGAITRTVLDAATVLDVLSGPDPQAMYNAPVPRRRFATEVEHRAPVLRVGLALEAPTGLPVDEECVRAAVGTARLLEQQGHTVVEVSPRYFSEEAVQGYITHVMDASVAIMPYLHPERAEPYLQHRMARARRASAADYVATAMRLQRESRRVVAQFGADFDVLVTPTMATEPVPAGELVAEANRQPDEMRLREGQMVSFTSWVNLAGLPAISLPLHTSSAGIPIGSQIVAGPWREDLLIQLSAALEAAQPWADRHPRGYED